MKTSSKRILCPFFKAYGSTEIRCEGPFDGVNLRLCFENRKGRDAQEEFFCDEHYKRCEIYRCVKYNKYCEDP